MKKTGQMIGFEEETGKQSAILKFITGGQALEQKSYPKLGPYDYNMDYIAWLESKAEAYDRLMSGGKKTLNEMANFFGLIVSVEPDGDILLWEVIPNRSRDGWYGKKCVKRLPKLFSDFSGDWKDSLTLPDGWEES